MIFFLNISSCKNSNLIYHITQIMYMPPKAIFIEKRSCLCSNDTSECWVCFSIGTKFIWTVHQIFVQYSPECTPLLKNFGGIFFKICILICEWVKRKIEIDNFMQKIEKTAFSIFCFHKHWEFEQKKNYTKCTNF